MSVTPFLIALALAPVPGAAATTSDATVDATPDTSSGASRCGTFPAEIRTSAGYGGMSDCLLRDISAEPLWRGLPNGSVQTLRFTFLQGHFAFFRTVQIDSYPGGEGRLVLDGENFRLRPTSKNGRIDQTRVRLSVESMDRLNDLIEQSGTFDHDIGTWDSDAIYLHCQTLDMERINAEGYRFSSINIGCNHPAKLMPLVNEVARLAELEIVGSGQLYR